MGKLTDHWNDAARGRMSTSGLRAFKRFLLSWEIVFGAECNFDLGEEEQATLDDLAVSLSFYHFDSIDTAINAYIQDRSGVSNSGAWLAYEQAFHLAAVQLFDNPHNLDVAFRVGDRDGNGVASLYNIRNLETPASSWDAVEWSEPYLSKRDPVGEGITRRILETALQAHFPDGPLAAGECRVAFLKGVDKEQQPRSTNEYRWACFETALRDNIAAAQAVGLPAEPMYSEELSFAAYLPAQTSPVAAPQTPKLQQNKP